MSLCVYLCVRITILSMGKDSLSTFFFASLSACMTVSLFFYLSACQAPPVCPCLLCLCLFLYPSVLANNAKDEPVTCLCVCVGMRELSPPPLNLKRLYEETLETEPVLLIISAGADPSQELLELAGQIVGRENYHEVKHT